MTYLVKVKTANGPVVHIARGEQALEGVLTKAYAGEPVGISWKVLP